MKTESDENKSDAEDESYMDVHVMPAQAGHDCSMKCWCEPQMVEDFTDIGGSKVWLHREIH